MLVEKNSCLYSLILALARESITLRWYSFFFFFGLFGLDGVVTEIIEMDGFCICLHILYYDHIK